MDPCTRSQGCQMKPKFTVKKENISDALLTSVKLLLQSRKALCNINEGRKGGKKGSFIEVTFLGLSRESGAAQIQGLAAFHVDIPELIQSLHICNLSENEVILLKEGKTSQSCGLQNFLPGAVCMMSSDRFTHFKSNSLYVLLSKYTTGIQYTVEQDCLNRLNRKTLNNEDDDTNQSVSSIEDDFVTAFEHLDEEESLAANEKQGVIPGCETMKNQRDASSQTQPAHSLDVTGSKIIFGSVRRRSSIKSAVLMGFMGLPELSSTIKNTVTTSICDSWKKRKFSAQETLIVSPSPADTSESECSSPSPIIFLDEEGYQKSMSAKLNLPKIPVGKNDIEDSDSELSEFFDSFDQFDDPEPLLETDYNAKQKPILASPPKKRKYVHGHPGTCSMNPQRFKYECPMISANVKKPTPLKPESPYSSICDVPDSPRPVKTSAEDSAPLFSPIRSSAFSPLSISTSADCLYHLDNLANSGPCEGKSCTATYSDYANRVCIEMFDSVLAKPALNLGVSKKGQDKATKQKRKSHNRDSERKQKSKQKPAKGGIQKFATELVEKSLGGAFKDLQKGVSSCTSALCHLAARLTSYVFQMAFYEIGRRQAFSIKQRAISGLANLMVSEVIASALQELRYIKKQMVTNAVASFAAELAEELVFEGIMEVCQFSHPPTPTVSPSQTFNYEDVIVSSYAKDLSESVIQEAFIELSQVNVTFTTQAAISVSMDNLKYVSSESLMQSTQTSVVYPNIQDQLQEPLNAGQESKKDYSMQYALFFTSGLFSSVPVPAAAKILNQQQTKNDLFNGTEITDVSGGSDMCIDGVENYAISRSESSKQTSDNNPLPTSKCSTYNFQQELDFVQRFEGSEILKTFSVTMVDRIVNEAYDDVSSAVVPQSVEDYAESLSKKVVEVPPQNHLIDGEISKKCFADDLAKCIMEHSVGAARHTSSDKMDVSCDLPFNFMDSSCLTHDRNILKYAPMSTTQDHRFSVYTQSLEYSSHCSSLPLDFVDNHCSSTCSLTSNVTFNQTSSAGTGTKIMQDRDMPTSSVFGLQSCLSHINSLSSVMCSCGDNSLIDDKINQRDSGVIIVPDTPPPTPLATYDISPERSMKKLSKKLKGHLAKEFYPATPPSTPHLSAFEQDCIKKDDFMLKLMRSLSEEVESSSTDESSEDITDEFEASEETFQYADYLSTNIISVATEMAAYSLDDEYIHRPAVRNRSLLSVLSDRWGYPAYMRNVSEETLDTLYKYAGGIVGEVFTDAKKAVGKSLKAQKKISNSDASWCNYRNWDRDCRPKERGSFKATDTATLSLPRHTEVAGLMSKYPSCESVTEEYADHIIRVLKMEGGNSDLIMDQYASRLVYSAIKSGLQQASKSVKLKPNRKNLTGVNPNASRTQEILTLLSRTHNAEKDHLRRRSSIHHCHVEEHSAHGRSVRKAEFTGLLHFAESLAHTITCDVRKKLKMSAASLPKSLTDSCLYTKSKIDDVSSNLVTTSFPKTLIPFAHKNKHYHSTGSLNENGLSEGIIQAIEQYACKVVDSTLEFSMEAARLQAIEKKKKLDKGSHAGKLVHSYGTACRLCSVTEKPGMPASSFHFLLGHDVSRKTKPCSKSRNNACQKPRLFHLNIPKIHIDLDKRAEIAEKIVSAAIEKAERELSNTSLAADSGIGQEGASFADSLTTEIMMSAMKNIGHVVNISSNGKDGFQSADSVTSQQTSISVGDDSTGSWSNLSFEDEHQDESSSFLHLSDSNGNSSSWSSLGVEGDIFEENLSFPPSDSSDGPEEKDEGPKVSVQVPGQHCKLLLIRNIDVGPCSIESHLRMVLQWIVASESDISELYFPETSKKELFAVSRKLREKDWKVGDLLQAVLQYCESTEKSTHLHKPLFVWLLENV